MIQLSYNEMSLMMVDVYIPAVWACDSSNK